MAERGGWLGALRDRRTARWRAGEIDDETFERTQAAWARRVILGVFAVLLVVSAVGLSLDRLNRHLEIDFAMLGVWVGFITILGGFAAYRTGEIAGGLARSLVLQRQRERVEADPSQDLTGAGPVLSQEAAGVRAAEFYGSYKRSKRFAYFILGGGAFCLAIPTLLIAYYGLQGQALLLGMGALGIVLWGLFLLLDRRDYLRLSALGIWCRGWGPQQHAFSEFKAVYPRQNATQEGIVFVPRDLEQFRQRLPWYGRVALRNGGGEQAHADTLTLWTTRVDIARDPLLRALQTEVVATR